VIEAKRLLFATSEQEVRANVNLLQHGRLEANASALPSSAHSPSLFLVLDDIILSGSSMAAFARSIWNVFPEADVRACVIVSAHTRINDMTLLPIAQLFPSAKENAAGGGEREEEAGAKEGGGGGGGGGEEQDASLFNFGCDARTAQILEKAEHNFKAFFGSFVALGKNNRLLSALLKLAAKKGKLVEELSKAEGKEAYRDLIRRRHVKEGLVTGLSTSSSEGQQLCTYVIAVRVHSKAALREALKDQAIDADVRRVLQRGLDSMKEGDTSFSFDYGGETTDDSGRKDSHATGTQLCDRFAKFASAHSHLFVVETFEFFSQAEIEAVARYTGSHNRIRITYTLSFL